MIAASIQNSLYLQLLSKDTTEFMFSEDFFVENLSLKDLERDFLPFILTCSLKKKPSKDFSYSLKEKGANKWSKSRSLLVLLACLNLVFISFELYITLS